MTDFDRIIQANKIFTPGFPVQLKDLFSGRSDQLNRTIEALAAPGRHPVIFGQRGVGKTSLANILGQVVEKQLIATKVSCDGNDNFVTIWNRVLQSATITFKQQAFGFSQEDALQTITLGYALGHDSTTAKPAEIANLLSRVQDICVIILDEFDKISDHQTKTAFADLVKIVSDTTPLITIIFVGVAQNIHELIGEHPSIDRNLLQIELPLMSDTEIREIFEKGMEKLGISIESSVLTQIPLIVGGYPHYAHLLGLCSAKACIENDTNNLTEHLFDVACNLAITDAIEKYRDAYAKATATTQVSRYPLVLCACAYAQTDSRGVFRATDVVDAIESNFYERVKIQAVVPALGEFLTNNRASILQAVKIGSKQCYRFADPMMRPYCRLKAREILRLKNSMS
jgi:Cdc6-like AAA superfamily ATPase